MGFMSRIGPIATFEFLNVAKRKSFLLATFGLPLFFSGMGFAMLLLQTYFLQQDIEQANVLAIVDHDGILKDAPIWTEAEQTPEGFAVPMAPYVFLDAVSFRRYDTEEQALTDLRSESIGAVYVVLDDYLGQGRVRMLAPETGPVLSVRTATAQPVLARLLRDQLLRNQVEAAIADRALQPLNIERETLTTEGLEAQEGDATVAFLLNTSVPFFLGVLLLTALLSASGYLVQAVANDKESKVVEVLLSSANADEILAGKLLGLGTAGLLQFAIWAAMVSGGGTLLIGAIAALDVSLPWQAIAASPFFFVAGYLFIGSLMLTTGSIGSNAAESQKLTLGWALLAMLPLMTLVVLLEDPHGALGQALTWIPFSAPLTVILRLSLSPEGISTVEVVGSMAVLIASTIVSLRLGSRLFRVGLLLQGSRPSLRELWRQMR